MPGSEGPGTMTDASPLSGNFEPGQLVVPVVLRNTFLGSAFFVRESQHTTWLMTAKHVVSDVDGLGVAMLPTDHRGEVTGITLSARVVEEVVLDPVHDIALLRVKGDWPGAVPISFGSHGSLTSSYLNPEFSPTRRNPESGQPHIRISINQGHVLRHDWMSDPRTGTEMRGMVLSWPAHRGASGSPVIDIGPQGAGPGYVAGMVLNNWESELLPAHIEEIIHEDESIERHTYVAPNGVAIEHRHLVDLVAAVLSRAGE